MATVTPSSAGLVRRLSARLSEALDGIGDVTQFGWHMLIGVFRGAGRQTLVPICNSVGVGSIPVVAITGMFIGMVLAVQSYSQFAQLGLATRLGSIINVSVVRELGPVLAATMLAGRVGGAMAAELATMRITEQVDALAVLGVDPVQYLGAPRLIACVLLIPLLTIMANFMGVMGGALVCIQVYHVDAHHYWQNTRGYVGMWDLTTGLIKPTFFGAAIAVVACHHGMNSSAGATGVGQAATRAFVASFVLILMLDFFLAMLLNQLHGIIWPQARGLL
jgi:phospholipid/cholesterol/gamma-HCH transport system permease protein